MERREAIKKISLAMGGALSASTLAAVFTHCSSKKEHALTPGLSFLKSDQYRIVSGIADRIIPASDTPGALEAQVPEFIDLMLFDCYPEDEKDRFTKGLEAFHQKFGKDISDTDENTLEEFLSGYEKEIRNDDTRKDEDFFIRTVKELTVIGFFTSEAGATKTLKYVAVPGKYDACIPLDDNIGWAISR